MSYLCTVAQTGVKIGKELRIKLPRPIIGTACQGVPIIGRVKNFVTIKNYGGYSHKNHVTRMRCQKRFIILKFQNIILSVADSGVIGRITFKSVRIYESRLFCLI